MSKEQKKEKSSKEKGKSSYQQDKEKPSKDLQITTVKKKDSKKS
ncbi:MULTISPECIES: hypothetical protein [Sphingobacterium]|uniref:Uncharacterized protein n=1 Tax=Sphingobacterium populi TaxID=1812824 RepID=A0ABW5U777_9SPHI|nr:hypothetical protein [Sphingobacterium sp. CFCC 11742]